MYLLIPVQWPSTFLCPGRQLQMYPPSVFSQVSVEALQLFNSTDSHSSMSVRKSKELKEGSYKKPLFFNVVWIKQINALK